MSDAELDVIAAAAVMQVDEGTKIKQKYTHLEFLEKIAEGYVIEAYNSEKTAPSDRMLLSACVGKTRRPTPCNLLELIWV